MSLNEDLLSVFTATIENVDGDLVLHVPERELNLGELRVGKTYRIAVLETADAQSRAQTVASDQHRPTSDTGPPVRKGDQLEVEIEDTGEQGDGIARVGEGYVLFVPDTNVGDRVTVEVGKTLENYGFAEVRNPEPITG